MNSLGPIESAISYGRLPQGYELQTRDIGRSLGNAGTGFGLVLAGDVGKRCYLRDGIFQMENDAQRDARQTAARHKALAVTLADRAAEDREHESFFQKYRDVQASTPWLV